MSLPHDFYDIDVLPTKGDKACMSRGLLAGKVLSFACFIALFVYYLTSVKSDQTKVFKMRLSKDEPMTGKQFWERFNKLKNDPKNKDCNGDSGAWYIFSGVAESPMEFEGDPKTYSFGAMEESNLPVFASLEDLHHNVTISTEKEINGKTEEVDVEYQYAPMYAAMDIEGYTLAEDVVMCVVNDKPMDVLQALSLAGGSYGAIFSVAATVVLTIGSRGYKSPASPASTSPTKLGAAPVNAASPSKAEAV